MNIIPKVAIFVALAGVIYLLYPADKETASSAASAASTTAARDPGPSFALPGAADYGPQMPPYAASHTVFELGPNGELIVDATTAVRLDLLLGELPSRVTRQNMQALEAQVKEGLPEGARDSAVRILNTYAAYRKAESELEAQPRNADSASAETIFSQIVALRRAHFGPQLADAMFAEQEAQTRFGIQSARIEADPKLSLQEKDARIKALQNSLPADVAAKVQDNGTQASRALEEQVAALRQRGASEADVFKLRQAALGAEDAQVITEMEAQKLQWERRYREFAQQKNLILSAAISEEQKQTNIEILLRQHYGDQEIDTVRVYDRRNGR